MKAKIAVLVVAILVTLTIGYYLGQYQNFELWQLRMVNKSNSRTIDLLDEAGVPRRLLRIYCLAGNEPVEVCEQRVLEIQSWGCLPIVQRLRPLDWLGGPLPTQHDWTEQRLIDFQRWGNRLSKGMSFADYKRGFKDSQRAGELV